MLVQHGAGKQTHAGMNLLLDSLTGGEAGIGETTLAEALLAEAVAQGLSNAQAAERLFLSPRTIDQHHRYIYTMLGIENRAAATASAIDHGLRQPPQSLLSA